LITYFGIQETSEKSNFRRKGKPVNIQNYLTYTSLLVLDKPQQLHNSPFSQISRQTQISKKSAEQEKKDQTQEPQTTKFPFSSLIINQTSRNSQNPLLTVEFGM